MQQHDTAGMESDGPSLLMLLCPQQQSHAAMLLGLQAICFHVCTSEALGAECLLNAKVLFALSKHLGASLGVLSVLLRHTHHAERCAHGVLVCAGALLEVLHCRSHALGCRSADVLVYSWRAEVSWCTFGGPAADVLVDFMCTQASYSLKNMLNKGTRTINKHTYTRTHTHARLHACRDAKFLPWMRQTALAPHSMRTAATCAAFTGMVLASGVR
eukprot:scaffold18065_cov18-Tisochrysis_lutea.AAC.1